MAQRIRSFDPMQMGKTLAVLYLLLGAVFAIPFYLFSSAMGKMTSGGQSGMASWGMGMLIALPIIYSICGFIGGIVSAWLYNLVAGWTGGVEMELQ
jgi:hypothetical protein